MRILHTPVRFHPYTGGVENYVLELGRRIAARGHEVAVVCADEPHASGCEVDGISVRRLSYLGKIANTNVTPTLPLRLLRERFDILHTHLPTPWSADWSAIVSWMRRKPMVLTYH
ncbi:MAG: glycosyltransferase, partial [Candidatus Undinarchaeales archaeon]|nr:glycosyltransferase [Candidatus Undinarchaeales archaeon]